MQQQTLMMLQPLFSTSYILEMSNYLWSFAALDVIILVLVLLSESKARKDLPYQYDGSITHISKQHIKSLSSTKVSTHFSLTFTIAQLSW